MAKLGRPKKKHLAKLTNHCKGVVSYRTSPPDQPPETGPWVFHAHWSADPLKDDRWADMVGSKMTGGRNGIDFLQEFEADDEAKAGERVYWAFDRSRNVIKPWVGKPNAGTMGVPRDWPIYIGADFGQRNKTAILFLSQDPDTKKIYFWNSIVVPKGIDVALKEAIYRVLCEHLEVDMDEMRINGAYKYYERAVPDPSAESYIQFFAMEPWAIHFVKKPSGKPVNRHRTGEARFNAAMWPAVTHCQTLSYVENSDGDVEDERLCSVCGKGPFQATPSLYIFDGAAPELCDQLEELIDKEATTKEGQELEIQEKYVEIPRDAADGARYVVFDLWDPDRASESEDDTARKVRILREKPVKSASDKLQLILASAMEEQEKAKTVRFKTNRPSFGKPGDGRYGSVRFKMPVPDGPRKTA